MFRFKLPDIGEGVVEAELTRWSVKEGDEVAENEVLAELLTDKATIEIPSPRAGRVAKLCCKEGEIVRVGAVLIEIEEKAGTGGTSEPAPSAGRGVKSASASGAAGSAPAPSSAPKAAGHSVASAAAGPLAPPPRPRAHAMPSAEMGVARPGEIHAVPAVREFARQHQVDLAALQGTGPGGRIMRRDVEAALAASRDVAAGTRGSRRAAVVAESAAAEKGLLPAQREVGDRAPGEGEASPREADPADWRRIPLRGLRRTIAERMVRSKFSAPHYTYVEEIDVTQLERRRLDWQGALGEELSPLALIARAVVRTLPDFELLNAELDEARGEIVLKSAIHLGIAAALEDGLVVPVIHDAGRLTTRELSAAIRRIGQRARAGSLTPAELRGGSFTISSLGKLGGIAATPILNPPEVAILAVGAIRTLPRYVEGEAAAMPRRIMNLSMSLDHRVVDGIVCARFVAALKSILESADFDDLPESA
ncbi:MAG: dihydrolipoamide acetyltransferase family protein [Planctomycetota bacterium]